MIPYSDRRKPFPADYQEQARHWFQTLRDEICAQLRSSWRMGSPPTPISAPEPPAGRFERNGPGSARGGQRVGGGGTMSVMKGRLFEKVGVNISTVFGDFSPEFRQQIPAPAADGELLGQRHQPGARICARPMCRRCI